MPPGVMGGTYAGQSLFLSFCLFHSLVFISSFSGNALSCAAAMATLDVFQEGLSLSLSLPPIILSFFRRFILVVTIESTEKLLQNCNERGAQFMSRLQKMKQQYPIKDVRGLGLMIATEFEDSLLQKDVLKVTQTFPSPPSISFVFERSETLRELFSK